MKSIKEKTELNKSEEKKLHNLLTELNQQKNPEKSKILEKYFQTQPGGYGEGDKFLGLSVPTQRKIAKKYSTINFDDISCLLKNEYHECRLTALFILNEKYELANSEQKKFLVEFYVEHTPNINNWDLVDSSAPQIIGKYALKTEEGKNLILKLSKSRDLWEKRISIIACLALIRNKDYKLIQILCKDSLNDKRDLIQKACGWMLREMGKKNVEVLTNFLDEYAKEMPRTMLRYSIERLNEIERKKYLNTKK